MDSGKRTCGEVDQHVGRGEFLGGIDLALKSEVLVVGAETSISYFEPVVRVRVLVVGVDATSEWLVWIVDYLSLVPAAGILL